MRGDGADLVRPLAARLRPAVALFAALLATGAPLAHHAMGVRALRATGAAVAAEVADTVAKEAQRRPALWRYDTIKLVGHLRAYRAQPGVRAIELRDAGGAAIDPSRGGAVGAVVWSRAAVRAHGAEIAVAWVAMDLTSLRARSLGLLALFVTVAALLGAAVTRAALGAAADAEARIRALLGDLAAAAARLEADVAARTADLARANDALVVEQRRQRETAARAIALQESERRAIGRDLHDSVGQALTSIRIQAELAEGDPGALARVRETTDEALAELRRALDRLGPAALADAGLDAAVARLLDTFEDHGAPPIARSLGALGELPPAVEVAAYRVVQEALTNALRHADARSLAVSLSRVGDVLLVRVADDGRGFDPDAPTARAGLRGMRERAELVGGSLTVRAARGAGVEIVAELPCAPDAELIASGSPWPSAR